MEDSLRDRCWSCQIRERKDSKSSFANEVAEARHSLHTILGGPRHLLNDDVRRAAEAYAEGMEVGSRRAFDAECPVLHTTVSARVWLIRAPLNGGSPPPTGSLPTGRRNCVTLSLRVSLMGVSGRRPGFLKEHYTDIQQDDLPSIGGDQNQIGAAKLYVQAVVE